MSVKHTWQQLLAFIRSVFTKKTVHGKVVPFNNIKRHRKLKIPGTDEQTVQYSRKSQKEEVLVD